MGTEKLPISVAASLCRSNPNPLDQAQAKDGWDSRPYLALGQGHKKTARVLSSPSLEISLGPDYLRWPRVSLAFTASAFLPMRWRR